MSVQQLYFQFQISRIKIYLMYFQRIHKYTEILFLVTDLVSTYYLNEYICMWYNTLRC